MKIFMAVLVAALLAGTTFAKTPVQQTWSGYLIDKSCATHILSKKLPADVTDTKVKGHTKECAMMDDCVASGYGIWTGGKFVKFDKPGDTKVSAFLEKTKKKDHIAITVTGTMNGDNLQLTSIKE